MSDLSPGCVENLFVGISVGMWTLSWASTHYNEVNTHHLHLLKGNSSQDISTVHMKYRTDFISASQSIQLGRYHQLLFNCYIDCMEKCSENQSSEGQYKSKKLTVTSCVYQHMTSRSAFLQRSKCVTSIFIARNCYILPI